MEKCKCSEYEHHPAEVTACSCDTRDECSEKGCDCCNYGGKCRCYENE